MKKKAQRRPTKTSGSQRLGLSPDQFSEVLDFLETVPGLQEAYTRADIELALDDRGWIVPGRQWTAADLDTTTRTTLVAKSRLYWNRDPLAKQAVRLWTDYSLGNGMVYNCDDTTVQATLEAFCKHRRNKHLMGSEGQRRSSKKLLVDGELFFAIFDDEPVKTIRRIDCLQITDFITDPDDDEHVLGYRRLTAANKILYYADWRCDDDDLTLLSQQKDPQTKGIIGNEVQADVKIYHIPFDTLVKRGNGLLFAVCDWSKEHRRFMEARVAITQALAKFAWKGEVQGGQAVIDNLRRQLESSYAQAGMTTTERHPQNAPASTWLQNKGVNMTPMPRSTGAGDAEGDGNQLKLMVSAGTGIMLHYFGDPSTGNLATATAMELPMLKMFESYQQLWADAYRDLFSVVLDEDLDTEPAIIDVDLPPILADDLQKLGTFITAVAGVFPEVKVPEVLQMCLISLGINNISEVMDAIKVQREKNDKAAAELLKNPPPVVPGAAGGPPAVTQSAEAMIKFAEAVMKLEKLMS
jgi:hypothetical protein